MTALTFLNLKPLTSELLPATVELDRLCFGGLWTLDGYQRELDSPNSDLFVLQPDWERGRNGEIMDRNFPPSPFPHPPLILGLGCLWAILEEAHITIVAVHPNYRRQGLGQALLLYLLSSAKQRGLERATLEVKVSNQAALSMYEKYGFRVAGRRRGYYQDTGEDALILWLNGIQYPEFAKNLADWSKQISFCLTSFGWDLHSPFITS